MNTFSTRTRRGAAILFSGVLVLGGLALTGEATAVEEVDGNPTCSSLDYTYGEKWDNEPSAGTYTVDRDGMDASLRVGTYDVADPNENNAILGHEILTSADGYAVVVKGGNGANVYRQGELVNSMHAPTGSSGKWPTISHFQLCWNGPATPQPEVGRLDVEKIVVGTENPDGYTFTICVTSVDTGAQHCKDIEGAGTVTFENLPVGEYIVTETEVDPSFSHEVTGSRPIVNAEATATATVTNTWTAPDDEFGSVVVTKAVTGDNAPADAEYDICLTGPDASTTKVCETVVGEGAVTFEDLVPGIYTVTETDPGSEYEVSITPTDTALVTAGDDPTAITVTNAYTAPVIPPIDDEVVPPIDDEVVPPTEDDVVPPTEDDVVPPTEEALPPTEEVEALPPTTPATPPAPAAPVTPAAPTEVASQATLPSTGSEGGIAAIAAILVAAGVGLTLLSKRQAPQQA